MIKTRDVSRMLHPDQRMKTSIVDRTRGPQPITRLYTGFRRVGVLVAFIAMLAVTFYSASTAHVSSKSLRRLPDAAAQSKAVAARKDSGIKVKDVRAEMERGSTLSSTASWLSPVPMLQTSGESVATFAADCLTPKTSFVLGETVCVLVTGAPLDVSVQRRISWVGDFGLERDTPHCYMLLQTPEVTIART